jgi:hypothetical protein
LDHLGPPLGPAVRMPDGAVRQPFAKVVFERPANAPDVVRLAATGQALHEARQLVPSSALEPQQPPPLPLATPPRRPAAVEPFVWSLTALVLVYLASVGGLAAVSRLRRRPAEPPVESVEGTQRVEEPVP